MLLAYLLVAGDKDGRGAVLRFLSENDEQDQLARDRDDESKWPEIQDAMIDAMIDLERALAPRVAHLSV